jgi:hypothetical protein
MNYVIRVASMRAQQALTRYRRWRRYRQALAELSAEMSKAEWPLSAGTRERLRKRAWEETS